MQIVSGNIARDITGEIVYLKAYKQMVGEVTEYSTSKNTATVKLCDTGLEITVSLDDIEKERAVLNCGEATAGEIDEEVMKMLKSAYAEAKKLLSENREALDKIAEFLIEKETITGKEFMKIFREVKGISEPEEGAVSGIEERGRIAMK